MNLKQSPTNGGVVSTPLPIKLLSLAFPSCHLDKNQKEGGGAKSGRKLDKFGFSCKANKCSDAGTGDLSLLPTHETLRCLSNDGSTHRE